MSSITYEDSRVTWSRVPVTRPRGRGPSRGLATLAAAALLGGSALAGCSIGSPRGGGSGPDSGSIFVGPDAPSSYSAYPDASWYRPDAGKVEPPPVDAAGTQPDAGSPPPPPPVDAGGTGNTCSPTFQNLLRNGNFDKGDNGKWTETATPSSALPIIISPSGFNPQSGKYVAWLLGINSVSQTLKQTVTIPTGSTQLRLIFYGCFVTQDTSGTADWMKVQLRGKGGAVLKTIVSYTNQNAGSTCGFQKKSFSISPAMGGQTVTLAFTGQTDSSGLTSFVIDTVSLSAACP